MIENPLFIAALSIAAAFSAVRLYRLWKEREAVPLDIKHLEGEVASTEIKVAGGSFEVEYRPNVATRVFQSEFAALQREQGEATQEQDEEWLETVNADIDEKIAQLIVDWDLQYDGEDIPVSAAGLDRLALPVQQALFQGVLNAASGGSEEEKKPKRRASRRSSS